MTTTITKRVYNFSAGPAVLPLSVLQQARDELLALPGLGMSVLEMSHRSAPFVEILATARDNLRTLLNIPNNYQVLFLQGGARLQFSMVPINLLSAGSSASYLLTGSWGKKAVAEARREGDVHIAWDGAQTHYDRLPTPNQVDVRGDAAYLHITSNETIEGVQFSETPDSGAAPLVCDASSDFLSRPLPVDKYGVIYACAQKNAGPAGVTVVIIRDDLLERSSADLHGYLSYRQHADNDSMFNTPPTFAVYMLNLVTQWVKDEIGGLEKMLQRNHRKAKMLYDVLDESDGFYAGHAQPDSRSLMNVTFRLPNDDLQDQFITGAAERDLVSLKGHRSVGGVRASIYNAMPIEGVELLRDFMLEFLSQHGN